MPSRTAQRAGFTPEVRMQLAEQDLDELEEAMKTIAKSLNRMTWTFVGAVISFTTAALVLAYQIALVKH